MAKSLLPESVEVSDMLPFSGHIFEVFDNVISQIEHLVSQQVKSVESRTGKLPKVTKCRLIPEFHRQ